jgi:hypothetical protein
MLALHNIIKKLKPQATDVNEVISQYSYPVSPHLNVNQQRSLNIA